MINHTNRDDAGEGSLRDQVRELLRSLLAHAQVRIRLALLEAKEASRILGGVALFYAVGGGFLFAGYLLSVAALVFLVAAKLDLRWEIVSLAFAGLHLAGGGILICIARKIGTRPLFEATLQELEKDEKWLAQNLPSKKRNNS